MNEISIVADVINVIFKKIIIYSLLLDKIID
jgi:hypothetical protein